MVPRVYVDTSVFGGCLEAEFRTASRRLLAACERGALRLVISELTIAELEAAPFRHIVNLQRIHAYNSVNLKRGYPLLEIRTPREVVPHE